MILTRSTEPVSTLIIAGPVPDVARKPARSRKREVSPDAALVRAMPIRQMLGGRGSLDRVVRAGWLIPVSQSKRLTLYRRLDVEAVIYRISIEGLP
jgi:hypothetical protein